MPTTLALRTLPESLLAYRQIHAKLQTTPRGAVLNFLLALHLYHQSQELGFTALSLAIHSSRLESGTEGFQGSQLNRSDQTSIATQLSLCPDLPNAFIQGCTPEKNYQLPTPPYRYQFVPIKYSGDAKTGYYRTSIECNGAAMPRTVLCRLDRRMNWRVDDWSALLIPVKAASHD